MPTLLRLVPTDTTHAGLVFDANGPLGLSRDFLTNLIAGEVAFATEILLILVFLPQIAGWLENKKWKGVRRLLAERLFSQNEQLNSWWLDFTVGCLEPTKYDGKVETPEAFREVDRIAEQFAFAMNADVADTYAKYRLAIGRVESLYRRLCIKFGGNTAANLTAFSQDLVDRPSVSFADIKRSFLALLAALGHAPHSKAWWDFTGIEARQAEADEIQRKL